MATSQRQALVEYITGFRHEPLAAYRTERIDGETLLIEIEFRKRIDPADSTPIRIFRQRFNAPHGIVVTRESFDWRERERLLFVPLLEFLLAS